MKILSAITLFLILSVQSYSQTEKKIIILHTNDLHSHLTGYGPEIKYTPLTPNDDKTVGGFARIATIIKEEKEKPAGITMAIDAGDFLMGTLFHALEVKTGFQLSLMKKMGYDLCCVGNHEFDFGPGKLSSIIKASLKEGEIPGVLVGNTVFNETDNNDDQLEELCNNGLINNKLILIRDDLKIGFFSIMGKDADNVAPRAYPVTFEKQVSFAKRMVRELQAEKCDIIICLSHSGVEKDNNGEWVGEDVELAEKVKGINLIISGHTHSRLDRPRVVNGVPVIQAGDNGRYVGRGVFIWNGKSLMTDSYQLIPIDDNIMGDREINRLIEAQKARITSEILDPLSLSFDKPLAEASYLLECNEYGELESSNLGPLVADAINNYINRHNEEGADVIMVAAGVIRDRILPGIQTASDIFRVMSLGSGNDDVPGYALSRLYVTGRELKYILEILQVAYKSAPDNFCYYSGIRVDYNPKRGLLRKILKMEIEKADGTRTNIDFSKKNKTLYSVAANSYMLEFFGIIKKRSFGLINVVPKDAEGNRVVDMKSAVIDMDDKRPGIQEGKEWLALAEFLLQMKDINGNGIPDIDKIYTEPVRSFTSVK